MATWQPPIPRGAFVEARTLGAGLVLLGYCYDVVKAEDGLIEVNLHELCPLFDTSYASVRRWWGKMQDLGIIERVEERGRRGVRAYFNPEWIDRRQTGKTRSESRSSMSTFQETGSPVSTNNEEMRSEMRSETSSLVSTNGSAYKVLMIPDQAGGGEDRDGTARPHPPAVALFLEFYPSETISREQGDDVCSTVDDLPFWRHILSSWRANGYKPRIGNLLDNYRKEHAKVSRNGTDQQKRPTGNHRNGRLPERLDLEE